jgi:polyphosphate kinase 2 (PPK2 family)
MMPDQETTNDVARDVANDTALIAVDDAAPEAPAKAPAVAKSPAKAPAVAKAPRSRTTAKPTPDQVRRAFEGGHYPYRKRLGRREYEKTKAQLQAELLKVQLWAQESGEKFVLLFEGRDAAGKGGTIKRFTEHLNPRLARVVALNKPTDEERGLWYFQRFVNHLPTDGEIVLYELSL